VGTLETVLASADDANAFEELATAYRTSGTGLFTGLGVFKDSGLPGWQTITERVMNRIEGGDEIFHQLRKMKFTLPTILTWASEKLGNTFTDTLRQALYQE
jgi:hypothetical protein